MFKVRLVGVTGGLPAFANVVNAKTKIIKDLPLLQKRKNRNMASPKIVFVFCILVIARLFM
jgi:hypothetical protein